MTMRKFILLTVAASGLFAMAPVAAEAKPFFLLRPFLPGYQDGYPPPDNVYYMDEEEYYQYLKRQRRKQRLLQDYYASQDSGYDDQDPGYYDQEPQPIKKKQRVKKKIVKTAPAAKAPPKKLTSRKPAAKPAPKSVASNKSSAPIKATTPSRDLVTASTGAAASGSVSCSKAANIVSGYGFDSVQTGSCSGSTYSFNASRGGKAYLIKVNAANGELTEVKKL